MLEDRKRAHEAEAMDASRRNFDQSLVALLDHRARAKHPEVQAAQAPVSERTLRTVGGSLHFVRLFALASEHVSNVATVILAGSGISNKTRSIPAFLPKETPLGVANFQDEPACVLRRSMVCGRTTASLTVRASVCRHKTRSELLAARRAEWRPPISYDFDGDGYVDNLELFIGCRLDTNKDGRIDTAERRQANALLEEMQANYVFGLDVRAPVMNGSVQLLVPYRRSLAGCWPGDDELH